MKNFKNQKGFTLIEILVVIGMIALLATIVLIAINPARQFKQGRDTQRVSNVNSILNAIGQKTADCKGIFSGASCGVVCPALPTTTALTIKNSGGGVDLSCLVPTYIASQLPVDPSNGSWTSTSTYDTNYTVIQDNTTGRVTVNAPSAEITTPIKVER